MTGTVAHYVSSDGKSGLQFDLGIGNRGGGRPQNENITLVLPPGLAFADHAPSDRYTIHFLGGNGGVGGTDDLIVTDPNAFDKGINVVVTWTESGVEGVRSFHFPITAGPAPTPFPSPQPSGTP